MELGARIDREGDAVTNKEKAADLAGQALALDRDTATRVIVGDRSCIMTEGHNIAVIAKAPMFGASPATHYFNCKIVCATDAEKQEKYTQEYLELGSLVFTLR